MGPNSVVGRRKKYLWRHPSGRWYVRKSVNGKMFYLGRITAEEGTAEFDQQYWEIVSGKKTVTKTSWGALIDVLRETDKWAGYSPRYRSDLEQVFEYLTEKIGRGRGAPHSSRHLRCDGEEPASCPICQLHPDRNQHVIQTGDPQAVA